MEEQEKKENNRKKLRKTGIWKQGLTKLIISSKSEKDILGKKCSWRKKQWNQWKCTCSRSSGQSI